MNDVKTWIIDLRLRGVELAPDGDRLGVRAPLGTLTEADREALAARKPEILGLLRAGAVVPEASPEQARRSKSKVGGDGAVSPASRKSRGAGPVVPRWAGRTGRETAAAVACPAADAPPAEEYGPSEDAPAWDGEDLGDGPIGLDTETALIEGDEVPPLAMASVSDGVEHRVIHPDRLGAFVRRHRDGQFVIHNAAFDYWVVAEHLARRKAHKALAAWRRAVDEGRMHDTMILDELIRLAESDAHPRPRDLGVVAMEYAGVAVDKSDPYRLRYGEVIGRDWSAVERGFFTYAVGDAIAALAAFRAMHPRAIRLMETNGHDPSRRS